MSGKNPAVDIMEMVEKARDTASVKRVFGEPITQDGVMIIPAARFAGGGGGGAGKQEGEKPGEGSGGGFGVGAVPAGAFVIKQGKVRWQPAVDVNRIVMGGQIVAVVALLTVRMIIRLRFKARARRR